MLLMVSMNKDCFDLLLTNFQPMLHFYAPRKHLKTSGFMMFSRGIEVEHWLKMS